MLRAANQNRNDCQWQSYLNVAHTGVAIPRFFREPSKTVLVREHPRLPCVKGAGMAVSRKAMTEGLSKRKVLIPSAPVCALGQLPLVSKGSLCPHPSRLRRATYTLLCNCHWQLLDFDSLRGAPPRRGRLWRTDCDRRESPEGATPVTWFFRSTLRRKTASRKIGTRRKYARYRQSALDGTGGNALDDELA